MFQTEAQLLTSQAIERQGYILTHTLEGPGPNTTAFYRDKYNTAQYMAIIWPDGSKRFYQVKELSDGPHSEG